MRRFDYGKIERIIEEHKDSLYEVVMGMLEDFFWTGKIIWENGEYLEDIYNCNHTRESYWATPIILLRFKDKEARIAEVYTGEKEGEHECTKDLHTCLSGSNYDYLKSLKKIEEGPQDEHELNEYDIEVEAEGFANFNIRANSWEEAHDKVNEMLDNGEIELGISYVILCTELEEDND